MSATKISLLRRGGVAPVGSMSRFLVRHDPFETIGALFAMYPDLCVSEAVLCRAYRASPGDYRAKRALTELMDAGKIVGTDAVEHTYGVGASQSQRRVTVPRVYVVPGQEAGYEELKVRIETLVTSEPGRWWGFGEIMTAAFGDDPHATASLSLWTVLAILHGERKVAMRIPEANPQLADTEYSRPPPPPKRFYERLAEALDIEAEVVREAWNAAVDAEKAEAATS